MTVAATNGAPSGGAQAGAPRTAKTNAAPAGTGFQLLGQPWSAWAFAVRIWLAMVVALYVAFWLQLDSPSSSMTTVAILALPRRGQAFDKAFFRTIATLIGFGASLVITALFTQSRDLLVVAYAGWLAACVFVAALNDGNRAYAAVLSGYTVAVVAISNIDSPQDVFNTGINRVAVIVVGIAAVAIINDVLAAPNVFGGLRQRLFVAEKTVDTVVEAARSGSMPPADATVQHLTALTAMRVDILTLPSERLAGRQQSAAARSAVAAMVSTLAGSRLLALVTAGLPAGEAEAPRAIAASQTPEEAQDALAAAMSADQPSPQAIMLAQLTADLAAEQDLAKRELAAMDTGRQASRHVTLPIHRERKEALRKAIRVFVILLVGGAFYILSSWPTTYLGFEILGVLAGLSATAPDDKLFAKGALIGVPVAAVMAGITEFIILDGADSFPLLAIAIIPTIFLGCFMLGHPKTAGIGFLLLVFFSVLLSASNPQSYNPETLLFATILVITSAVILAIALTIVLPTTDKMRRRWVVERLRDDLIGAADPTRRAFLARRLSPTEMTYLAADRITQVAKFHVGSDAARHKRLSYVVLLCVLILAATRARTALDGLGRSGAIDRARMDRANGALGRIAPDAMAEAAADLAAIAPQIATRHHAALARAVTDLMALSTIVGTHRSTLRHLRRAVA